jgi:hypothetical protein
VLPQWLVLAFIRVALCVLLLWLLHLLLLLLLLLRRLRPQLLQRLKCSQQCTTSAPRSSCIAVIRFHQVLQ